MTPWWPHLAVLLVAAIVSVTMDWLRELVRMRETGTTIFRRR